MSVNELIDLNGATVTVRAVTYDDTDLDDYLDPAVATSDTTEKAVIQKASIGELASIEPSLAGLKDVSGSIGLFKSNSTVTRDKIIVIGSVKYQVLNAKSVKEFDTVTHIEAALRLLEEG